MRRRPSGFHPRSWLVALLAMGLLLAGPARAQETPGDPPTEPPAQQDDSSDQAASSGGTHLPPHKSGYVKKAPFAGPDSVGGQLEEDDRIKQPVLRFPAIDRSLQGWFDWKKKLNEHYGLQLGVDYNTLYQGIDDSLTDEDDSWSAAVRVFGRWALVGRDTGHEGALVFKFEHRTSYASKIAPSELPGQAGYLGVTGLNFNDAGFIVGDFYWQQWINDTTGLIAGRYDPNDFMNVLGYANPWTAFSNLAVLLDVSVALPDWSWGVGAGHLFADRWYVIGSISDANGVATDLDFFKGGAEFFKFAEVGWYPTREERYLKKVSLTLWHVDEREDVGIGSAHGAALSANWTWNKQWMVFGRAGWSDGDAPLYNQSGTLGLGRLFRGYSDVLGLSVNRGNPSADGLSDQTTVELFYRLILAQNLQLTPSIQMLFDPALNPEDDFVWAYGLRIRLSL